MIEVNTQQPGAAVRDPVCGMSIDPAQAFATRMLGNEIVYFCSERCVKQFDREHASSATTGEPHGWDWQRRRARHPDPLR